MQTRTYTEKSNARRAARAAGIDPSLVFATDGGFAFPHPNGNDVDPDTSARLMCEQQAEAEATPTLKEAINIAIEKGIVPKEFAQIAESVAYDLDSGNLKDDDDIPAFCKMSGEERKAGWERNPPKPAPIKETTVSKAKAPKRGKTEKQSGSDKDATLHKMLAGKGSTVEDMCKALGWLPHTLRARISRLNKPKSKGGEGFKIERERKDGVTSYRIA